jgi:hypothetical protein
MGRTRNKPPGCGLDIVNAGKGNLYAKTRYIVTPPDGSAVLAATLAGCQVGSRRPLTHRRVRMAASRAVSTDPGAATKAK